MVSQLSSEKKFKLITGTLSWFNETFIQYGIKPIEDLPEAWVCNSHRCVLAKALSISLEGKYDDVCVEYNSISMNKIHIDDDEDPIHSIPLPLNVQEFVKAFDAGEFPELIAESNPKEPDPTVAVVE